MLHFDNKKFLLHLHITSILLQYFLFYTLIQGLADILLVAGQFSKKKIFECRTFSFSFQTFKIFSVSFEFPVSLIKTFVSIFTSNPRISKASFQFACSRATGYTFYRLHPILNKKVIASRSFSTPGLVCSGVAKI